MTHRLKMAALALATVTTIIAQPTAASANLITNGSFEDITKFVPNADATMDLPNGSPAMTGWNVIANNVAWIGPTNPFGLAASDGGYFLDLTSYNDSATFGGVTQSIATNVGSVYTLSFDIGGDPRYGLPSAITATAGLTSQTFGYSLAGNNIWETETLSFTATSPTTLITLQGQSGSAYIGLDNVSANFVSDGSTPVPEPAGLALLGTGLLCLVALRRRSASA